GTPVLAADPAHCVAGEPLAAGQTLDVAGLEISVLDTPGHTSDSVCFLVDHGNAQVMFTGDTILGRGTTVVAHPDGDLGAYLGSLERLSSYGKMLMLPGHGPVREDVSAVARAYLVHRRERLTQVKAAIAGGARTAEQVVDLVYPDIDPAVRFAAVWSASAQLDYLNHKIRESGTPAGGLDSL
ncbi:MAG TPA: MBL fold metallo-hydrolase, partial [Actinoplanes sp.]|nr:MBL fold metallo-hydrolase [Actinoplanes sp.]